MSLTNVWLQTLGDGLVRADQVTGIDAHQTPALTGKRSHWLLDVVLPTTTGSGTRGDWVISVLHRTLVQTPQHPGVIVTSREDNGTDRSGPADDETTAGTSAVRFRFTPFETPPPGRHTGAEYL